MKDASDFEQAISFITSMISYSLQFYNVPEPMTLEYLFLGSWGDDSQCLIYLVLGQGVARYPSLT